MASQAIQPPRPGRPRRGEARNALMHAALELVSSESNFSALSLRHVARQAGVVPTAFYRHFEDMEALGLTLIDITFEFLRHTLREADIPSLPVQGLEHHSLKLFAHHVRNNRLLFQFVVKERFSGSLAMRKAIHRQINLLTGDLASDLARFKEFSHIDNDDLDMIAELVINTFIALSERILEVASTDKRDSVLMERAEKQLHLIFVGVNRWRSARQESTRISAVK